MLSLPEPIAIEHALGNNDAAPLADLDEAKAAAASIPAASAMKQQIQCEGLCRTYRLSARRHRCV